MTVTDTFTTEITIVYPDFEEGDELLNEKDYENWFKSMDGMAVDDVHVKKLKHFVNED